MVQLAGKEIGTTGYGLMGLTWRADPPPQEQSFRAMRASLANGANFWNGGELYGTAERNSLHLLNEYFTKYPEDVSKVVISIKGGLIPNSHGIDGGRDNVRRSIDECLKHLTPVGKKLDLFECARVDPNTPIETSIAAIDEYVKEGKLGGISLSEVSANSIRRAAKVAKISAVEVEVSLFSTEIFENGIAQACAELDIPVIAYSPLGRGFLTGQIKKREDIPDRIQIFPRFSAEHFDQNIVLVQKVEDLAAKKGCTVGQIAIAWLKSLSGKNGLPVIIPIPGATTEERIQENMADVQLSDADMKAIQEFLAGFTAKGDRYGGPLAALMNG
ncbi:Aldo/keto reductase [Aulographum hederae CBS 113979]|uniref:Aldo/keto reductase n=1 Tax=Aulographum hederae CBS 113979 TaxID=1176131 RepID=A0A6G1GVI2_9PEZI|nr:Aldo/keto reductase [Aulographum hederae CBS 113979]